VFSLKPAAKARSIIEADLRLDLKKVCSCSALSSSQWCCSSQLANCFASGFGFRIAVFHLK
jgi:hypothetical protein